MQYRIGQMSHPMPCVTNRAAGTPLGSPNLTSCRRVLHTMSYRVARWCSLLDLQTLTSCRSVMCRPDCVHAMLQSNVLRGFQLPRYELNRCTAACLAAWFDAACLPTRLGALYSTTCSVLLTSTLCPTRGSVPPLTSFACEVRFASRSPCAACRSSAHRPTASGRARVCVHSTHSRPCPSLHARAAACARAKDKGEGLVRSKRRVCARRTTLRAAATAAIRIARCIRTSSAALRAASP